MLCTKNKYTRQKYHAKMRGIPFDISFEEWKAWWGDDLPNRGKGLGKLQMCRHQDKGGYSLDNIYKGTCEGNSHDKFVFGFVAKHKLLSPEQVEQVLQLLATGLSTRKTAVVVGTNQKSVMRIKHGKY